MSKLSEAIRSHPFRTVATGCALAFLIDGAKTNTAVPVPAHTCRSPWTVSPAYLPAGSIWEELPKQFSGIDASGVVITTKAIAGVKGEQIAYGNPAQSGRWERISNMIPIKSGHMRAAKLVIGSGAVEFGVRFDAPEHSAACNEKPQAEFTQLNEKAYFHAPGVVPMDYILNGVVNQLGQLTR